MNSAIRFNQKLIEAINTALPSKSDQLELVMNVIFLGKEAAYRRLRGSVPFTFSEACMLTSKLGLSLDEIVYVERKTKLSFELRIDPNALQESYYEKLYEHDDSYTFLAEAPCSIMTVWNTLPYSAFFAYPTLSKFYIFMWIYQTKSNLKSFNFSDLEVPQKIKDKLYELASKKIVTKDCFYIFDRSIFSSFLNEVKYFYELNLISADTLVFIKEELLELLNSFECIANTGRDKYDNSIWIYLSEIDFTHNYTYIEQGNIKCAYIDNIYLMNTIVSYQPEICKMHKNWIESLRKYSTLISISGERERIIFFEKQRESILSLS